MKGRRGRTRSGLRARLSWPVAALTVAVVGISAAVTLPLRWWNPPASAFMVQYNRATPPSVLARHQWTPIESIAPSLAIAVVAAEDQRFLSHRGFDLRSILKALEDNRSRSRPRGGSTISQQLAKNLFLWPRRRLGGKVLEAWLTLYLELFLPKRRILELYLNFAQFGPGLYGAGAAASAYFAKSANDLTAGESALLAAVLPTPSVSSVTAPSEYIRDRADFIESQAEHLARAGALAEIAARR